MKKSIKFFGLLLGIFILHSLLELIIMSVLTKLGVKYMGMGAQNESFSNVLMAITVYYTFQKIFVFLPAYCVLAIGVSIFYLRKKDTGLKQLVIIQMILNLVIFLGLWFYFNNRYLTDLTNPLLGLIIASVILYLLASFYKNPSGLSSAQKVS